MGRISGGTEGVFGGYRWVFSILPPEKCTKTCRGNIASTCVLCPIYEMSLILLMLVQGRSRTCTVHCARRHYHQQQLHMHVLLGISIYGLYA